MTAKTTRTVWTWLPGSNTPTQAGSFELGDGGVGRMAYHPDYLAQPNARPLDPRQLPFSRKLKSIAIAGNNGLPGVFEDAKPAGYGADRLRALSDQVLSDLDLMDLGPPDCVGAIEVTNNIERKLRWRPHTLQELQYQMEQLPEDSPASRALRSLDQDDGTSAGGERPKLTVEYLGRLWLAKLQDRGDAPHLPSREFTTMSLASLAGIDVPAINLILAGNKELYLIERFDRTAEPHQPQRHLFASAHTVLRLALSSVRGDPRRSYLVLADEMRKWMVGSEFLTADLQQLWRRMAFNALVGNADDHPRNHGLINRDGTWRLAPAFDITPATSYLGLLSLAVSSNGSTQASATSLIESCNYFKVDAQDAVQWLTQTAVQVASNWENAMRKNQVADSFITKQRPAFVLAEQIAEQPDLIVQALEAARTKPLSRAHVRETP